MTLNLNNYTSKTFERTSINPLTIDTGTRTFRGFVYQLDYFRNTPKVTHKQNIRDTTLGGTMDLGFGKDDRAVFVDDVSFYLSSSDPLQAKPFLTRTHATSSHRSRLFSGLRHDEVRAGAQKGCTGTAGPEVPRTKCE